MTIIKPIAIWLAFTVMSFTLPTPPIKMGVVKMKEETWQYHWSNIEAIRKVINESDLPHQRAVLIIAALDSLRIDISKNIVWNDTPVGDTSSMKKIIPKNKKQ